MWQNRSSVSRQMLDAKKRTEKLLNFECMLAPMWRQCFHSRRRLARWMKNHVTIFPRKQRTERMRKNFDDFVRLFEFFFCSQLSILPFQFTLLHNFSFEFVWTRFHIENHFLFFSFIFCYFCKRLCCTQNRQQLFRIDRSGKKRNECRAEERWASRASFPWQVFIALSDVAPSTLGRDSQFSQRRWDDSTTISFCFVFIMPRFAMDFACNIMYAIYNWNSVKYSSASITFFFFVLSFFVCAHWSHAMITLENSMRFPLSSFHFSWFFFKFFYLFSSDSFTISLVCARLTCTVWVYGTWNAILSTTKRDFNRNWIERERAYQRSHFNSSLCRSFAFCDCRYHRYHRHHCRRRHHSPAKGVGLICVRWSHYQLLMNKCNFLVASKKSNYQTLMNALHSVACTEKSIQMNCVNDFSAAGGKFSHQNYVICTRQHRKLSLPRKAKRKIKTKLTLFRVLKNRHVNSVVTEKLGIKIVILSVVFCFNSFSLSLPALLLLLCKRERDRHTEKEKTTNKKATELFLVQYWIRVSSPKVLSWRKLNAFRTIVSMVSVGKRIEDSDVADDEKKIKIIEKEEEQKEKNRSKWNEKSYKKRKKLFYFWFAFPLFFVIRLHLYHQQWLNPIECDENKKPTATEKWNWKQKIVSFISTNLCGIVEDFCGIEISSEIRAAKNAQNDRTVIKISILYIALLPH